MASISKASRFIIISFAFVAGAVVAVAALSTAQPDGAPSPWKTLPVETLDLGSPFEFGFRCQGVSTFVCIERMPADIRSTRLSVWKRDPSGRYTLEQIGRASCRERV